MATNNQKIINKNLKINNVRRFLLKVTEKEEINERKNPRKILINSEDLETVRQRYYNHSESTNNKLKKNEANKTFCHNKIHHLKNISNGSNFFSLIKNKNRKKRSFLINMKNNTNYNFDDIRDEDEGDLYSIYLHYLLKKENACIQIKSCENFEDEFKKILKLLGSNNKKKIDYNIQLLHKYCNILKKRSLTPEKTHKKIFERKKTYKVKIKEKGQEKIPIKNEIVRKSLPVIFHKKNSERKNNKTLNNIFETYKKNKCKKKLKKNITLLKVNSTIVEKDKIKKNKENNDQNTSILKIIKTKNNSPLESTHIHKKIPSKKRKKEKKETAKYPIPKKFKHLNFLCEKNEIAESRRKSCFQLANRINKKRNKNSKNKKHNELTISNSHSRQVSKNKEDFDSFVKTYKRQNKSSAEQMKKSHKLSKEKYIKKPPKKYSSINKIIKKKCDNIIVFNDFGKNINEENENKNKKNNLFSNNEQHKLKSKIVFHKTQTQNLDIMNLLHSKYEVTYNEEGMDELLFMKKMKRNRKK